MIAKIKYFEEYDRRSNIFEPLSSVASIASVSIIRNEDEMILTAYSSLEDANIANGTSFIITDYNNEPVYVADLYTDESLELVKVVANDKFATIEKVFDTHLKLIVTSEDKSNTCIAYVLKHDIGMTSDYPILYSAVHVESEYSANETSTQCNIFAPQNNIGAIHIPNSYWSYNPLDNVDYLALTLKTNGSDIEYIAFNNEDPDNESLSDAAPAFTITDGRAFTVDETEFLDSAFVYVAITKNSQTMYYKIVKNVEYETMPVLEKLKSELNDKYVFYKFGIAVPLEELTSQDIQRFASFYASFQLINDLKANNVPFSFVDEYYSELIDTAETTAVNQYTSLKLYNTVYDDVAEFAISDPSNFAKDIALMLLELIPIEYTSSKTYLQNIAEVEQSEYLKSVCIQSDLKAAYLGEIANSYFIRTYLNSRQIRWISGRLRYMLESNLIYEVSNTDLSNMLTAFESLGTVSNSFSESSIYKFFDLLHTFKLKSDVVQNMKW